MFGESNVWRKKVWRMNRSALGLSIVTINLDGFSLANRRRFAKFAKLSPRQTFQLYGMLHVWCHEKSTMHPCYVFACTTFFHGVEHTHLI